MSASDNTIFLLALFVLYLSCAIACGALYWLAVWLESKKEDE